MASALGLTARIKGETFLKRAFDKRFNFTSFRELWGPIAQLVEHVTFNHVVLGSSPSRPTFSFQVIVSTTSKPSSSPALQARLEYTLARFAAWFLPRLSRPKLLRLARVLARIGYWVSGRLRRVGDANLALVFPEWTPAQRRASLQETFFRFTLMLADLFWFSRDTEDRLRRHVRLDPSADKLLINEAWLGVTGHFGHWELLGMSMASLEVPLMSVAAPLTNPEVDKLFVQIREQTGGVIVPQAGAIRKILQGLRNGQRMAVLLDQNTLPRDGGVWVSFFGRPTPVSSAPAILGLKTEVPARFGFCTLQADGNYSIYCPRVIARPKGPPEAFLQELTTTMEGVIRQDPASWLWMYKRWKYLPEGADPANYPYYSRPLKPRES